MLRSLLAPMLWCILWPSTLPAQTADVISGTGESWHRVGDPNAGRALPKGTIARLGSLRLRSQSDHSHGVQFSPAGTLLILAASRNDLFWFDLATGRIRHNFGYAVGGVHNARLLDSGVLLYFHSKSETDNSRNFVTQFDPNTGKIGSEIKIEMNAVDNSEFDRMGRRLLVHRNKKIALFDTETGTAVWTEKLEQDLNAPPVFLADGSAIVVADSKSMRILDSKTGQPIRQLDRPAESRIAAGVTGFVVSPDGRWIAGSLHPDSTVVWDAQSGRLLPRIGRQKLPLGFTANGRLLSVASTGAVGIWNVSSGERLLEFPVPVPEKACLSADGKQLAARVHDSIVLYDIPDDGMPMLSPHSAEIPGLPDELTFEPDGSLVGRLSEFGGWAVWRTPRSTVDLVRPPGYETVIGLTSDRRKILSATQKQFVISNRDGNHSARFKHELSHSNPKRLAAMTPDGRLTVAVHEDGLAQFNPAIGTTQVIRSRFANRAAGTVAAVSADGLLAATEGYDPETDVRHVELFSLATNQPLREIPIRGPAERLEFSRDGRRLAVVYITANREGSQQKNLLVVDPQTGREMLRQGPTNNTIGPRLAVSPDGRTIAWGTGNQVQIHELLTGQIRAKLPVADEEIHSLALASDGRMLAAAGTGWPVILWDLSGESEVQAPQSAEVWEGAWRDLGHRDAATAYQSARRMARAPGPAIEFLRSKLKPVAPPDSQHLAKRIGELDAPAFVDRQNASRDLRSLGELAIPELTRTLETTESAEVRERIEVLLKQGHKPTQDTIRNVRAVELLGWLDTSESRELLGLLSKGAASALQTLEAQSILVRIK